MGSPTQLWNKVMKEVQLKHYAGPYDLNDLPYSEYMQSPIGLVPKSGNKTWLIFHLSYDFGPDWQNKSLNFHTPEHLCTVCYNDLDHAVANSLRVLREARIKGLAQELFYSKSDCSSAFRILPILPQQRKFLVMMAVHPATGKEKYFIDLCLPFGASISCAQFQAFSDALKFIVKHKLNATLTVTVGIMNYFGEDQGFEPP